MERESVFVMEGGRERRGEGEGEGEGEGPVRALGRSATVEANHTGGGIGPSLAGLEESAVLGLHVSHKPQQGGAGEGD